MTNIYQKRFIDKRRAEHLCIRCGKPVDGTAKSFCNACLEKRRRYYLARKNGCDWHDCETCPHDDCISDEKSGLEFIDRHNADNRHNYLKRRADTPNLCSKCHRNIPEQNHKYCSECLKKEREYYRSKKKYVVSTSRVVSVKKEGICSKCGEKVYKGKLCKKHYMICVGNLNKVQEHGKCWREYPLFTRRTK